MVTKFRKSGLAIASVALVSMAGCGGGDSGDNSPGSPVSPPLAPTTRISGSAAVGVPLTGTVTVKDALGISRTVNIGANGAYEVDVTGLTAPFVFRASGTANGQTYTVHSIATSADAGGKVNITQLTDLIVANIAGQVAQAYFDRFEQDSNASAASKTAVDAEISKLREKLLPVLTALGVEAGVDLLRTPFTPLSSALDKALDAIRVSIDSSTNLAIISTLVNNITVTDDLTVKAAAETSPATLSAANVTPDAVAAATGDAVAARKALTDFEAKFANGLPVPAVLTPLLTSNFLTNDENGTAFINWISSLPLMAGGRLTNIDIPFIDYSDPTKVTARAVFSFADKNGIELERQENWRIRKGTDGVWRLHGNQRVLSISGYAHTTKSESGCVLTGLEFDFENFTPLNDGGILAYVLVTGPGLPVAGLRYNVSSTGGQWSIDGKTSPYYVFASSCFGAPTLTDAAIAALPDNANYTVTGYTSANTKVVFPSGGDGTYGVKIPRRPLTLAEAVASKNFPVIQAPTTTAFTNYTGGPLDIVVSGVKAARYSWVYVGLNSVSLNERTAENVVAPKADGTFSTSLTLTASGSGDAITWRNLRIATNDAGRRSMMSTYGTSTPTTPVPTPTAR